MQIDLTPEAIMEYFVGLDIGSTTVKIAVLDFFGKIVYKQYERHY